MNYYETLYIIHPALESGRLKDIILSIEESLKNMGGSPLSTDLWGKKRLAYLIDKQKYGTYVQLQFTGIGNTNSSFGLELEHNPNILAYLTTSIDKTDVKEQEDDLDSQIAGQSRENTRNDDEENVAENIKKDSNNNNEIELKESNESEIKDETQETTDNETLNENTVNTSDKEDGEK